ncbi:hypothetical protein CEE39_03040 [bacterium (candidate division B38) B3_B38]|nr:MAG: hypothetical protein CEE39_03040 [bacterium (candidate division B38) B3_B38]
MSEKVVIVGANLEGLEIMALMRKDPQIEVVALIDPDKEALGFNLEKYGYRFSDEISVSFYHDLQILMEIPEIDIIVDASNSESLHQQIYQFSPPEAQIMKANSAKLIRKMKASIEVEGGKESLQREFSPQQFLALNLFLETANSIDLTHNPEEFYHLLLNVGLQGCGGNAGSLMLMNRNEKNLLMVAQKGLSQAITRKPELRFPKIGEGIAGRVAQIGEALLLSGNYDDLRYRHLLEEEGMKSLISVPIKTKGSPLGVISVGHNSFTDAFSRHHLAFMTELAAKSAKYLAEIRTYQKLQDSRDEQVVRGSISEIWDSSLPIKEKLQQSVKKIHEELKIDSCDLYLRDPYSTLPEVTLQASLQINPNLFGLITYRDYQGTIGKVLKLKRPLLLKEYASGLFSGQEPNAREEFLYLLPMIVNFKLLGVITFHFSGDPNLTDQLLTYCREISGFLAHRIYQELEKERWQQKMLKISAINESGMDLINISNEEKLYFVITASAAQLLEAEMCILRLYQESANKLLVRSSYGFKEPQLYREVQKLDGRICLEVFKSKLPLLIPDLYSSHYGVDKLFPLKSALCSPLVEEKTLLGTLSLYNKIEDKFLFSPQFTMDDREILGKFTSYVSKSIVNLQELNRKKSLQTIDELTGMFNERYLRHRLHEETQRADRYKRELSLIVLKIEDLSNLSPGRQSLLISRIGADLEKLFRSCDIFFHLAPDKFAIIFPEMGNQIKNILSRLINHFSKKPSSIKDDLLPVSMSAGYSSYPITSFSVDELISQASFFRHSFTIDSSSKDNIQKNIG